MNKYLDTLSKMKHNKGSFSVLLLQPDYMRYLHGLEKIEQFVKGEITSQELMQDADNLMNTITYYAINKIINYEEKDIRYYIELPLDNQFWTGRAFSIVAGKVESIDIKHNNMKVVGPKFMIKQVGYFYENRSYAEIVGDFSKFPKGVMLYRSDWFRIISKYPRLLERMYYLTVHDWWSETKNENISLEEVQQKITEKIQKAIDAPIGDPNYSWVGKEKAQYLPQEVIDSIQFVTPKEYLTREQVLNGDFGTFEEILNEQDILKHQDGEDNHIKRHTPKPRDGR